jgi:hypothetical protein
MCVYELRPVLAMPVGRVGGRTDERELDQLLRELAGLGLVRPLGGPGDETRYEVTGRGRSVLGPDLDPAA